LIWMIKFKTIKTLIKELRKKKKSKVEGPNWKTSYTQIRIEGLKLKKKSIKGIRMK